MSDKENHDPENPQRRDFLNTVTGIAAGAGIAAASWPFISSMNPSTDVLAKGITEVDLSAIEPGQAKTIEWQGKPVFILHRTPTQIDTMRDNPPPGKQPQPDAERIKKPEWLVVVGLCTHLGCVPGRGDDGWFCPCHGSVYDNSGRILHGPAPRNLDLPPYEFISNSRIIIGTSTKT